MITRFADAHPDLIEGLKQRYGEPHRAYHTWTHIEALLESFQPNMWARPDAAEAALYYHDAIYEPLSANNEADSATLMRREMGGRMEAAEIDHADAIILATAKHQVPEDASPDLASDIALFLDLDLKILGASPLAFDHYDMSIRKEFSAIPDEIFLPRRRAVMATFLERDRIYLTESYHREYDAQARANLTRLIERLPEA